ncbi:6-phosphofructokinase isozyme 2 [mine drainage metagenome]|uniref:6-phosphofructokinase isozyme 2 n=1 Tax=mine drainage metagenome TaxID=410659 RepID=A0A1J5T7I1_9ZZZZ
MGCESIAMYFSGGFNGNFFKKLLTEEKIQSLIVPVKTHTRTNIIVVEKSTGLQYRFGMESQPLRERDWKLFLKRLEKQSGYEYVVASGSLPEGVPPDFFGRMSYIAKKANAKLIVDTSREALQHALEEGVYMIKPNLNELSLLYGKEELKADEAEAAARSIISKKGSEVVVVSMGKEASILVTAEENHKIVPPAVTVRSTVGAGDSMVAGMVYALSLGLKWHDVLLYGVAFGTAATMNNGTALCKKEDVEKLIMQMQNENKI